MGLSLMFTRIDPDNAGGDWAALKEFLTARDLHLSEPASSDRLMDVSHPPEQLAHAKPGKDDVAWIFSGMELQQALTGTFGEFIRWRDRVLSQPPPRSDG